jgi:biotin synthase
MTNSSKEETSRILEKSDLSKEDIIFLLQTDFECRNILYRKAAEIKEKYVGKKTYFRGLIEFSNKCAKNCYYCGIRAGNKETERYELDIETILSAVRFAWENQYASIVLQGGEREDKDFVKKITEILQKAKSMTNGQIGITLSLGEQTEEVYRMWKENGADRYLLRIESSNRDLYYKIHPNDKFHNFDRRMDCLNILKKLKYQLGTGVMIGLPFQTYEILADDLLFFKAIDVDMVGMGPYIVHENTPLAEFENLLLSPEERFNLSLKMTAILRILMKDINIAAATALQAIDPVGREKAIKVGANIIMPNITPSENRKNYLLYQNKPCIDEGADDCTTCLEARINISGDEIGYGERGDAIHYKNKNF